MLSGSVNVSGKECALLRLLGRGKGGYSYLAVCDGQQVVLKQIHHEPCDYYTFGDKLASELADYQRLRDADIPVPTMIAVDAAAERIVKAYIPGPTVFELVRDGVDISPWLRQVRRLSEQARRHGLNIDWFPTNFVPWEGTLWYVDYECNAYMDEWSFENWGVRYWSRTPEFEAYLREHASPDTTINSNA